MVSRNIKNIVTESFWMAIDAIRKNKLRSSLTLLGISIGVFSVIGVMTAIRTLESSIASGLNVFATNTFVIQKYPEVNFGSNREYRKRKNIDFSQYQKFKSRSILPILVSVLEGSSVRNVRYKDRIVKNYVDLIGGDDGTIRFYNTYISDGRNFIEDDIHFKRNVCVLGMDVVDRLFPFEDPISKKIKVDGLDYFVIGVTERQGEAFGQSKDNFIAIPISTYLERFSEKWTTLSIHVESSSESTFEKTKDEAIGLMRSIRKVKPEDDNDFEVWRAFTPSELLPQLSYFGINADEQIDQLTDPLQDSFENAVSEAANATNVIPSLADTVALGQKGLKSLANKLEAQSKSVNSLVNKMNDLNRKITEGTNLLKDAMTYGPLSLDAHLIGPDLQLRSNSEFVDAVDRALSDATDPNRPTFGPPAAKDIAASQGSIEAALRGEAPIVQNTTMWFGIVLTIQAENKTALGNQMNTIANFLSIDDSPIDLDKTDQLTNLFG